MNEVGAGGNCSIIPSYHTSKPQRKPYNLFGVDALP